MRVCSACCLEKPENNYRPKQGGKCASCVAEYMRAYREKNAVRIAALRKAWALANADRKKAADKKYAEDYPERRRVARGKWATKNAEIARKIKAEYKKANPGKTQALSRRRVAAKMHRTPVWLTSDDYWLIEQAYELAALRTKMFGFQWHVDHVLPLQGKLVSGLHVPTNLQVIPWLDNVRKGNRV